MGAGSISRMCLTQSLPNGAGFPCFPLYSFPMCSEENLELSASPFVKSNFFFFSNLHARIPLLKAYIICVTQLLVPAALAVQHNHGSSHVSYLCFAATIFCSCCKSSLGFLN